ncbi:Protein of unknown function [Halogranum amylolyticum]|uniref:DUF429 domain-containing protein n=1 Tax=Halogranum amylolyticum TaxID=660520 RepID=A0A1H8PK56_9EURY|nr:DUF429 domain-containing protein [Halogranum amylolyticum]SEO42295.1 Protein of unknown function [Halogranum amylolyticum]
MNGFEPPSRVYGVDFRGGDDADDGVWVAEGVVDPACDGGEGFDGAGLRLVDCRPATERFDCPADREALLPALAAFLGRLGGDVVVGVDFPFGVPAPLVGADDWETFVHRFPSRFASPEEFSRRCVELAKLVDGGVETRLFRETDEPLSALPPYDPHLAARTFYGIRDVLRPLVTADLVQVHPMQSPDSTKPSLLEVYPAGTLEDLGLLHVTDETDGEGGRQRRESVRDGLVEYGVAVADDVRHRVDDGDDALDAVVAAVAAYRNTRDSGTLCATDGRRALEGYTYV